MVARHDGTNAPPFSKLDVLSCRNLLIYFEPLLQKKVVASFHYALKDTGVLLLGKSESPDVETDLFHCRGSLEQLLYQECHRGSEPPWRLIAGHVRNLLFPDDQTIRPQIMVRT